MCSYLDANDEALAWWEGQRKLNPDLPGSGIRYFGLIDPPPGSPQVVHVLNGRDTAFTPAELNGYFLACWQYRRMSLWAIAWDRWSRKWQRCSALCREFLSIWRA